MDSNSKVLSLHVTAEGPEQQQIIENIFKSLDKPPVKSINIEPISKKFLPYEIVLLITVELVAQISADLIVDLLEKLWKKLKESRIPVSLNEIPTAQAKAEGYLKEMGVNTFKLNDMTDGGLYASFVFADNRGVLHDILVSKTGLEILKYARRKRI